jgi:hypothetical protein
MLIEADTGFTNFKGKAQDDGYLQLAAGPEFDTGADTTIAVQAVGLQHLYGGKNALQQVGVRSSIQHNLDLGQRIGFSVDARRSYSGFSPQYGGWQIGGYASYALSGKPYANTEIGAQFAVGGDLPKGITAGIAIGASRAWYDAPLALFSAKPRSDWRLNGRVTLGLRSMRVLGFSPSVSYSYANTKSTLPIYQAERSRFRFALARYF